MSREPKPGPIMEPLSSCCSPVEIDLVLSSLSSFSKATSCWEIITQCQQKGPDTAKMTSTNLVELVALALKGIGERKVVQTMSPGL